MKKILLTGFEPFGGEQINPSQELLGRLAMSYETLLLPVSFEMSWPLLKGKIEEGDYDFVVMMGQAGGRSKVCMERITVNLIDQEVEDKKKQYIAERKIVELGPEAYISELPLRQWCQQANVRNLPIEISNTAGLFVCNYIYYLTLNYFKTFSKSTGSAIFIHLPYQLEQLPGKSLGTPGLGQEQMADCLYFILDQCKTLGAIK